MTITTIAIDSELKEKIQEFGNKGETYSKIIVRLLESAKQRQLQDLLMNSEGFISIEEAITRHKEKWSR